MRRPKHVRRAKHVRRPTRAEQRSKKRRLSTVLIAGMSLGIAATAVASHGSNFIDLTTADATVTHDGAVFIQGGTGAGTGNYDPFLQVQETGQPSDGIEEGYNTEPNTNGEFDTKSINAGNTHKLQVASIPTLEVEGTVYREFSLDSNDTGNDSFMSIDEIKLFVDDQFALTGYNKGAETFSNDTGTTATKIYDLDASDPVTILANTQSLEPGSGVSDITVLIPNSAFPPECYYGSLECDQYLIFWTVMGGLSPDPDGLGRDYDADSGFEEWRVRRQPVVNVTKTADPAVTITHTWDITKTVVPDSHDGFVGGTAGTSTWTVVVDETETPSNPTVSGLITITNPTDPDLGVFDDPEPAWIEGVTDLITQGLIDTSATVTCPEPFPFKLDAGNALVCSYSEIVPNTDTGINTATVTISDGTADFESTHTGSDGFDFADATETHVGPESVIVDDDRDTEGQFPDTIFDDATYDYDETFTCSSDPGDYTNGVDSDQYDNIATLADDQGVFDQDDASVTVDCYLPGVSKTANGTNDETHNWTIDKDPDATYQLFAGESQDHGYTITLDETVIENNFVVTGTITVSNPNPDSAVTVTLSDELSDGTPVDLSACDDDAVTDGVQVDVAANGTTDCGYSVNDAGGDATSNIATITINGVDQFDDESFTYVPNVTNPSVNVTDDNGTPGTEPAETADDRTFGPFTDDDTAGYTQAFDCSTTVGDYTNGTYQYTVVNTATIDETGANDFATVTVHCYLPDVSKTATGSYTETHTWDITKTDDATYSLVAGDSTNHPYTIAVDETVTDSGFTVSGAVTVTNPHPTDSATVTLTDQLNDGTDVTFSDCADEAGDAGIQVTVAPGAKVCNYSVAEDGDDGDATSNLVTMAFNGTSQDASQGFMYQAGVTGPTEVNVTDDNGTPGTEPEDTADDQTFGPFGGDDSTGYNRVFDCSTDSTLYTNGTYQYQVVNTATIDETGANDDATVTVNCYLPVVTKTAQTSFTRTYNWVIEKDALLTDGTSVPATGLELAFGQSYNLEWQITVDLDPTDPVTDTAPAITGVVTVANPAPVGGPSMTVDVTDEFTPVVGSPAAISVDCDAALVGDQNTGIVIPPASSVDCSYSLSTDGTSGKENGTNVATATLPTGASATGSEAVDFSDNAAQITEVDATVIVTDTFNGTTEILGSASVYGGELPKSFSYFTLLSSDATTPDLDLFLECGEQTILNRADVNTDVNSGPGVSLAFATREVLVTVDCDLGCTLTLGYWKTHNDTFWGGAPTDDTWALIGDADGDGVLEGEGEEFFLSGMTWFEVFWTAPKGNAYYNLAHQWMAATLNTLNGASTPDEVATALSEAGLWLATTTPAEADDLKGREAKFVRDWASLLDDYNNGLIGPGHCDEDGFSQT